MGTIIKTNRHRFPGFPSIWDDFFGGASTDWVNSNMEKKLAAVNVKENDKLYTVEVAAPGMKKGDFKIELDNNRLTISAEKQGADETEAENGKYSRKEFNYQSFSRSFTIDEKTIKSDKIKATYEDGILYISIPKLGEEKIKTTRMIEIK